MSVALAQESALTATPDVPPVELCTIEAPSLEQLNAAILSPVAIGTPIATRTPGTVPEGVPADAETSAQIVALVRELVACFNTGESLRSFGLYTDGYLRKLFDRQGGFTRAVYDSYATPEPIADSSEPTAILEIKDIRVLDDGTVGATVTLRYASIPMPKTFFMSFVYAGDRWLISGILGEISFSVP